MLKYVTTFCGVGLLLAVAWIAVLRSDLKTVTLERNFLQTSLQANVQFIANDIEQRHQNEKVLQKQVQDFANDKSPDPRVGPLLGGVVERMPEPNAASAP